MSRTELSLPVMRPNVRDRRVRLGAVPVRVVDEVENLRAELRGLRSADVDVLEERDVPLILARVVDLVPRPGAERARRGPREHRGLNQKFWSDVPAENSSFAPDFGSPVTFQGLPNVSPVPAMSAPSVTQSGVPERMNVAPVICQPPSTLPDHAGLIAIERQVVDVVEVEHVAAVEARVAPESRVVVVVEQHVALAARVVLRVPERVRDAELEAVRVAPLRADLQAVVLRVAGVLGEADDAVALVRPQRGDVDAGIRLHRPRPAPG